jgi:hypothetical protein
MAETESNTTLMIKAGRVVDIATAQRRGVSGGAL